MSTNWLSSWSRNGSYLDLYKSYHFWPSQTLPLCLNHFSRTFWSTRYDQNASRICSFNTTWRQDGPWQDCVFVTVDLDANGIKQLEVARVLLFFSFVHETRTYPCAIVHWFPRVDEASDADTGMRIVQPEFTSPGKPALQVIPIDTIARFDFWTILCSDFSPLLPNARFFSFILH